MRPPPDASRPVAMASDEVTPDGGARFVFVGGLHPSGTSVVARMLADTDGATGLRGTGVMENEGHYLHDVVPSAHTLGGPGRFAFNDRAHLGPSVEPFVDRAGLREAWAPFWGDPDAKVLVEKSPQNLLQTVWLQSVEPSCRFVIVTRHPATVALATKKWTRPGPRGLRRLVRPLTIERLIAHWFRAHHLFEHDRPQLDHVVVVRFEDLFDPASDALSRLERGLGLTGPIAPPTPRSTPSPYEQQWRRWLASRSGARSARTWLPMAEAAMSRWGYSLDDELI